MNPTKIRKPDVRRRRKYKNLLAGKILSRVQKCEINPTETRAESRNIK
jgi:hypothetical protein